MSVFKFVEVGIRHCTILKIIVMLYLLLTD